MLATLALTMVVGGSDGWTVSERVVRELIPLIQDDDNRIYSVAHTLSESGNKDLAYLVLDRSTKRGKDPRYNVYRREGKIDLLLTLIGGWLPDNSKYPLPIRNALDYPGRQYTDRALTYIAREAAAGRDAGLGMVAVDPEQDTQELLFMFCQKLQTQRSIDEMLYAAEACLNQQWLGRLLRVYPSTYLSDTVGYYDESMRPALSALVDRLITKYPNLFEEDMLIRFAGILGSEGMVRAASVRLLDKAPVEPADPDDEFSTYGDFRDMTQVVSRLVEGGHVDDAKKIVQRHREFVVSCFRSGSAHLELEDAERVARAADSKMFEEIAEQTRLYILNTEADALAYRSYITLGSAFKTLYYGKREKAMYDLIALAEDRRPKSAQGYLYDLLRAYVGDKRYEDAVRLGFKHDDDVFHGVFREMLANEKDFDVDALLTFVDKYAKTASDFRVVALCLDLIANRAPRELLRTFVDRAYPAPIDKENHMVALEAVTAYCAIDEEEKAKPYIQCFLDSNGADWDLLELVRATTRGKVSNLEWLDDKLLMKFLDRLRHGEGEAPDYAPELVLGILQYAQNDAELRERLVNHFAREYPIAFARKPDVKRRMLETLIYSYVSASVPHAIYEPPTTPPYSIELQDRILEVIRHVDEVWSMRPDGSAQKYVRELGDGSNFWRYGVHD